MNEVLKQMQQLGDKQQLTFILSNPNIFVDNPLLYFLAVNDSLQSKLSYMKYLNILNDLAVQKRNPALLKATSIAIEIAKQLKI